MLILPLALAAAYVMTYPAIEVDSPTLVIVDLIAERGGAGIEAADLHQRLDDAYLLAPRLKDLVDEGLITVEGGRYRPLAKGVSLARLFAAWRRVLGAGMGG
jgi:hypothetical protein